MQVADLTFSEMNFLRRRAGGDNSSSPAAADPSAAAQSPSRRSLVSSKAGNESTPVTSAYFANFAANLSNRLDRPSAAHSHRNNSSALEDQGKGLHPSQMDAIRNAPSASMAGSLGANGAPVSSVSQCESTPRKNETTAGMEASPLTLLILQCKFSAHIDQWRTLCDEAQCDTYMHSETTVNDDGSELGLCPPDGTPLFAPQESTPFTDGIPINTLELSSETAYPLDLESQQALHHATPALQGLTLSDMSSPDVSARTLYDHQETADIHVASPKDEPMIDVKTFWKPCMRY